VKDSNGAAIVVPLGDGVGPTGFEAADSDGVPAIGGAAVCDAPQPVSAEAVNSAQLTSHARLPLLAGCTAPRSPSVHRTSLLAAGAVRTL